VEREGKVIQLRRMNRGERGVKRERGGGAWRRGAWRARGGCLGRGARAGGAPTIKCKRCGGGHGGLFSLYVFTLYSFHSPHESKEIINRVDQSECQQYWTLFTELYCSNIRIVFVCTYNTYCWGPGPQGL
jgi:hypothetical protein